MCKLEKNLNKIGVIIGIMMIIIVIMAMTSCSSSKIYNVGTGEELTRYINCENCDEID
jgi:hypothetical protein